MLSARLSAIGRPPPAGAVVVFWAGPVVLPLCSLRRTGPRFLSFQCAFVASYFSGLVAMGGSCPPRAGLPPRPPYLSLLLRPLRPPSFRGIL